MPITEILDTIFIQFLADVEAGWKFWKKKDKDEATTTTTVAPITTSTVPTKANAPPGVTTPTSRPPGKPINIGSAVLGAADPGLAVGVTSTGGKIKETGRPSKPNPGTEVGLDFPASKPGRPGTGGNSGQGYREWAVDLTGAGEPGRQSPKLPGEGPALNGGGIERNLKTLYQFVKFIFTQGMNESGVVN